MDIQVVITGRTPLVLHNVRLADPLDPYARAIAQITAKGKDQTDADRVEVGKLEWEGSLYSEPGEPLTIPSWNVVACFRDGGKATKKGSTIVRALTPTEVVCPVDVGSSNGAKMTKENTWRASARNGGMGRGTIFRTRPRFRDWSLVFSGWLEEEELSFRDLKTAVERAGVLLGLGDANKLGYGRFEAKVTQS
jgi:hypothetical protein